MHFTAAEQTLVGLCVLSGALHVLSPDHWLPASVVAWQKGWRLPRTGLFSVTLLALHVLVGASIFFCLDHQLLRLHAARLFHFALALVFLAMTVRMIRFTRLREVLRAGPGSRWGIFAVVSLLGPCESIIPILIKSHELGAGYLVPIASFLAGTLVVGSVLIMSGQMLWDRPFWLPRSVNWAWRGSALLPVMTSLVLGISAMLRM